MAVIASKSIDATSYSSNTTVDQLQYTPSQIFLPLANTLSMMMINMLNFIIMIDYLRPINYTPTLLADHQHTFVPDMLT